MIKRTIMYITPQDFSSKGLIVPTADDIEFKQLSIFIARAELEEADLIVYVTPEKSRIMKSRTVVCDEVIPTLLGITGLIPSLTDILCLASLAK